MTWSGTIAAANTTTLLDAYTVNAVASASTLGYHKDARAFTVTEIGIGVSGLSDGGTGNTVVQITDGTNTCQASYACNTVTTTAGAKSATVSASAGTCTMAAATSSAVSIASSNCTYVQPTISNVWVAGKRQ